MDKSKWPQEWKDQYNSVITKRLRKERQLNEWRCPEIWRFTLNETNVFAMLGHCFPLNRTLKRIITRFFKRADSRQLLISSRYLYEARHVFPAYYSDRERLVVQLNKFQQNSDLDELVNWLPFYHEAGKLHLVHLMIGVLFLNEYLSHLHRKPLLESALYHLKKARYNYETHDGHLAFTSLIAFGHYMHQDFETSLTYLDQAETDVFHQKFDELIRKVA